MDFFLVMNEELCLQTKSQLATSSLDSVGIAVEPRYVLFIEVFIFIVLSISVKLLENKMNRI